MHLMIGKDFDPTAVPAARREPHARTVHGDTFIDDYEWLRDKTSVPVREFVEAQNTYCEQRNAHLKPLRTALFNEFVGHIQQTDMSVPTRIDDYWYFVRTQEGKQYAIQCRIPIQNKDDWDPPVIDAASEPGSIEGEQIIFDANKEAEGHDFFRLGGMDISKDGRWMLYGTDVHGDERYDFRIRDLETGEELPDCFDQVGAACFTPDAQWVFLTEIDDAWRPYRIVRHRVGTPRSEDVTVFEEHDERFWAGIGLSFDEKLLVIGTGSKTTTEVLMLPVSDPTGEFQTFIPRKEGVEYDVSFASFEGAGDDGEDIPLAIVYHNSTNPNFEIDVIDMRGHQPPFKLGEGRCIACGSPYGCEEPGGETGGNVHKRQPRKGDTGADPRDVASQPVSTPWYCDTNPPLLQGAKGLAMEGIAMHRHYVALSYRADGLPHLAVMTKDRAAQNFLNNEPWQFEAVTPPDSDTHVYSIGAGGNPNYDAPRMRYSFSSYTRPGELHDLDPATGDDRLLKRATVLNFNAADYEERREWITVRDGEQVPVSLVWRTDKVELEQAAEGATAAAHFADRRPLPHMAPAFVLAYGAYEISSDPSFSVGRLGLLDRGVVYVLPHVRGGGEMGRAWYEQGRQLNKKHTFEDFIDVTVALQNAGIIDVKRTVANGGSAGGLLMGAVANMAPERFAGIEADVPFVDALTTMLDPTLPLTVTEWDEWGDPLHNPEVYEYMKSYSPYENAPAPRGSAQDGPENEAFAKKFPKIFITTSMNDTRVMVVEPLKWVARLQAADVDAIIRVETEAGHGGTSGRYKQWEQISYENSWCLGVMGITE